MFGDARASMTDRPNGTRRIIFPIRIVYCANVTRNIIIIIINKS